MKEYIAMLLIGFQLLSGSLGAGAASGISSVNSTPTLTIEPNPKFENPLNGEIIEEPYTGRIFASTISNVYEAIPHLGVNDADILMEMYVNNSVVRCLALYSDLNGVRMGGVRSARLMFHQLSEMYDMVLLHSGGSTQVINDAKVRGFDQFNIDSWDTKAYKTSYRNTSGGRKYENSLFGNGENIVAYAAAQGMRTTQPAGMDYGLDFADEGTPASGEAASTVNISLRFDASRKDTIMKYNADLDKYEFWQYNRKMTDIQSGEAEAFKNVIVMNAEIYLNGKYQMASFTKGGDGYFACGGKLVPITWTCASDKSPIEFFNADGTPLELERGNTYIAIAPQGSVIEWE